jgi:hypothetical protein
MISFRNLCVLCNPSSNLIPIKTIMVTHHLIDCHEEYDLTYGYCENCYSVQIMTLLDPSILYDGSNLILPFSNNYNWIQHNISFVQFIVSSINPNESLLEIGSSSFLLGKHLIEYYKDYTVFDISLKTCNKRSDVKYIEGNCENYQFEKGSNIIMSHVFEHLYEPKKFIENCFKNNVKNIIISIPNMNNIGIIHVTNQHTYLYKDQDIEYIFSLYNYKCSKKTFFNTSDESFGSIFLHFSFFQDNEYSILRNTTTNLPNYLYINNFLNDKIYVPKNTFIATAGMFSVILFSLIENKENVIGVIDQNNNLHKKLFANTKIKIYPYEYLRPLSKYNLEKCQFTLDNKEFLVSKELNKNETISIIIHHPRKNDIINSIHKVNDKINIICI